ncbi:MAG: cysteine-rich VLP domain-containing protein [Synergistaceae bacterium]|nr:cysteine-rich VLP domain-containing protein [Synergistaceae bacterium]
MSPISTRVGIRKPVVSMCANYDREYACMHLGCGRCYILDIHWPGSYCKYFQNSVLPRFGGRADRRGRGNAGLHRLR